MSAQLRLVEVGPRDGLQSEQTVIPTRLKVQFIADLVASGLHEIEATSFVNPARVPQLADAEELWSQLPHGARYSALVPNQRGLDRALELGVERIALFTGTSDAFTKANIGMDVAASLDAFEEVTRRYKISAPKVFVRGYVSTAFECPFSGRMDPARAVMVGKRLFDMGVDEVCFADTLGTASVREVKALVKRIHEEFGLHRVAFHFHDTWGMGLANVAAAYELGVTTFDSSAGGLGGCPFAPGAGGNVATEDLVYFFEREGLKTGIDLYKLACSSLMIYEILGRDPASKAQIAQLSKVERFEG